MQLILSTGVTASYVNIMRIGAHSACLSEAVNHTDKHAECVLMPLTCT